MEKISVIIITNNEERNIAATLDAAWKVADEILVADSGSVDQTETICREKNVQFIRQPWLGFGAQRNATVLKAANEVGHWWLVNPCPRTSLSQRISLSYALPDLHY